MAEEVGSGGSIFRSRVLVPERILLNDRSRGLSHRSYEPSADIPSTAGSPGWTPLPEDLPHPAETLPSEARTPGMPKNISSPTG